MEELFENDCGIFLQNKVYFLGSFGNLCFKNRWTIFNIYKSDTNLILFNYIFMSYYILVQGKV